MAAWPDGLVREKEQPMNESTNELICAIREVIKILKEDKCRTAADVARWKLESAVQRFHARDAIERTTPTRRELADETLDRR